MSYVVFVISYTQHDRKFITLNKIMLQQCAVKVIFLGWGHRSQQWLAGAPQEPNDSSTLILTWSHTQWGK